jgi:hypothetical protein
MARYGDGFTFLYVDEVHTSQEAHASTTCYVDNFTTLFISMITRPGIPGTFGKDKNKFKYDPGRN